MNITDIRIRLAAKESRLRALASVTFDDAFVVHDIRLMEGDNGLFAVMPCKKMSDGSYKDIAHPLNADARRELTDAIASAYISFREKKFAE